MARHIGQDISIMTVGGTDFIGKFTTIELDEQNLITTIPAAQDDTVYRRKTGTDFSLRLSGVVDGAPVLERQIADADGEISVVWKMATAGSQYTVACLVESVKLSIGGDGTIEELSCVAKGTAIQVA